MLSIRNFLRSKREGRRGKNINANGSRISTIINEEYKEAFRTKSYTEMCKKIQSQLETRINLDDVNYSSSSSSPSPPPELIRLSELLVEPGQETLVFERHRFLASYFKTSLEAGNICESVLQKLHEIRIDYHTIRKAMEQKPDLYEDLASFALHTNPFSTMTPQKFLDLHETHQRLLQQLTSKVSETKKQKKVTRFIKRAFKGTGCAALAVSLPFLAVHSTVAMPVLVASCLALFLMKKFMKREKGNARNHHQSKEVAMDAAARGVYILINDFDTMSRLVQRLNDEMEHRRFAAGVCVRRGKNEAALKEVIREFQMHELGFMEQLEELEKQIYLCFLDINRSRRLLIQQLNSK